MLDDNLKKMQILYYKMGAYVFALQVVYLLIGLALFIFACGIFIKLYPALDVIFKATMQALVFDGGM